jgi:hypothetical protein
MPRWDAWLGGLAGDVTRLMTMSGSDLLDD